MDTHSLVHHIRLDLLAKLYSLESGRLKVLLLVQGVMLAQIAVLIPLMRPHRIASVVRSIAESTEASDYRIIVIATGECADAARELPVTLLEDNGGTWPQRINAGYKVSTEPMIFAAADDLEFHPGWFEAAMRSMSEMNDCGVVAVNDLMNRAGVHLIFSRSYIETVGAAMGEPLGTVICESVQHAYSDDFARRTAMHHERWRFCNDSVVEHLHCGLGKAPSDEVYTLGESSMAQGYAMYQELSSRFESLS